MITVIAALLSAILFYLSHGLDDVWLTAWIAPAPILWLAYGRTPLWQVIAAAVFAFLCGQIYAVQCYGDLPPMLILSVLAPITVMFAAAIAFARWVSRATGPWATWLAFPVAWTAMEFLYESSAPNGTFGAMAYSQMSAPLLIQSASLFGLSAITFLLCLFANTMAMAGRRELRNPAVLAAGVAIAVANAGFGWARLAAPAGESVTVAALDDEDKAHLAFTPGAVPASVAVAETYAEAARAAAGKGARLIVTSEASIGTARADRAVVLKPLLAVAHDTGADIVVGIYDPVQPGDLALLLRPDGSVTQYDKRHLVPFLEDAFTPGRGSGWTGNGRAMEICKDMDFPATIRADAARGVRLAAVPAGDFGADAWLHARMAVLRGVENGFAMVRAAHRGLLTVNDAQGRLIARRTVSPSGMSMVVATVPLGSGPTLYTRIGDVFAYLTVVVALAIGGLAALRRKPKTVQES
ncbi:nitrilase-related carbon-nitrogen hydrolase [Asticcacaulis solisilvae]|uniref:nitrilase-related carbon-nitrogen hydrolase n=1 Tax=Asticcacaulis solisilvae TaxID=1217274 RepID=UPI003FD8E0ED